MNTFKSFFLLTVIAQAFFLPLKVEANTEHSNAVYLNDHNLKDIRELIDKFYLENRLDEICPALKYEEYDFGNLENSLHDNTDVFYGRFRLGFESPRRSYLRRIYTESFYVKENCPDCNRISVSLSIWIDDISKNPDPRYHDTPLEVRIVGEDPEQESLKNNDGEAQPEKESDNNNDAEAKLHSYSVDSWDITIKEEIEPVYHQRRGYVIKRQRLYDTPQYVEILGEELLKNNEGETQSENDSGSANANGVQNASE